MHSDSLWDKGWSEFENGLFPSKMCPFNHSRVCCQYMDWEDLWQERTEMPKETHFALQPNQQFKKPKITAIPFMLSGLECKLLSITVLSCIRSVLMFHVVLFIKLYNRALYHTCWVKAFALKPLWFIAGTCDLVGNAGLYQFSYDKFKNVL